MELLLKGYKDFREKYVSGPGSLMENLSKKGQHPKALCVACSDSRVDPALLFQCDPGDIFMVRNVANLVPPYGGVGTHHHGTSAALEFGLCYLDIPSIIILGHSQCGGIEAHMTQDMPQDDFLSAWLKIIPDFSVCADIESCAKKSLVHSGNNLRTFPWIKKRLDQGRLAIHLLFFHISQGMLEEFNPDEQTFNPL